MRRRRFFALLLLGVGTLGGYAVWCARPFYQYPSLRFSKGVSEPMQAYITAWDAGERLFRPVKFTWRGWGYALCHPYEPGFKPIQAGNIANSLFEDEEEVIVSHPSRPLIQFRRDRYGYDRPSIQFSGPPGFTTKSARWSGPDRSQEEAMPESFRQPPPVFRPGQPTR